MDGLKRSDAHIVPLGKEKSEAENSCWQTSEEGGLSVEAGL